MAGASAGITLAAGTPYKHKLTVSRLETFCNREGFYFIKDITLSHLTTWRARWTYESPLAKRNNQERMKGFFKFCYEAGLISANPAGQLSSIQVKADESSRVRPFEPKRVQGYSCGREQEWIAAPQCRASPGVYAAPAQEGPITG